MFTQIYLSNFRNFNDSFVDLKTKKFESKHMVLLFGNGATGKTNFLKTFSFLRMTSDSLTFDRILQTRTKSRFNHNYEPVSLQKMVYDNYCKFGKGTMKLAFEVFVSSTVYFYELELDINGTVYRESLVRKHNNRDILIFSRDKNSYTIGYGMIRGESKSIFENLFKNYFENYTMLSIIRYGIHFELVDVKETMNAFVDFVSGLYIVVDGYDHEERHNYFKDLDLRPHVGHVSTYERNFLDVSSILVTELLVTTFKDISKFSYLYEKKREDLYYYEAIITMKSQNGSYDVGYKDLPKSIQKAIDLATALLDRNTGSTIVIDNFSNYWNRFILNRYYFDEHPYDVQSIMTFSSVDVMNDINPRHVFLIDEKNQIQSVDKFDKVRAEHNVRMRYESEKYVKLVLVRDPEFYKYDAWFREKFEMMNEAYKKR